VLLFGRGEGLSPEPDPVVELEELPRRSKSLVLSAKRLGELPWGEGGGLDEAPLGQELQGPLIEGDRPAVEKAISQEAASEEAWPSLEGPRLFFFPHPASFLPC